MRKNVLYAAMAILVAGLFVGLAVAGNGNGPGDGTGIGSCVCETSLDIEPADGICDICGGCIPEGDGPESPNGRGNGKQIRDGSCLTTLSGLANKATEMRGGKGKRDGSGNGQGNGERKRDGSGNGQGNGERKRDGSGEGKGGGDRKRDGSCEDAEE